MPACHAGGVHPVLFQLFGNDVSSYGFALAVAFAAGIALAFRRAKRHGIDPELFLEIGIGVVLTSLFGSRLLWVLTHREQFQPPHGTWSDAFSLSGLSMQGGIVLALAFAVLWTRFREAPVARTLDVGSASVALGEAITRVGCFLNGCCHGVACSLPIGVTFPPGSIPHSVVGDVAIHATQLYLSVGSLALFALLSSLLARPVAAGVVASAWLAGAGLLRLVVDAFRYYEPEVTLFTLGSFAFTVNTPVSLGMIAAGAWLAWRLRGDD